jgi:hypothetical protein
VGNKTNQIQTNINWGLLAFTPGCGEMDGSSGMSFPRSSYSSSNQCTMSPKLPNPNQNSNSTITIHKHRRMQDLMPVDADGVVWVRISALYVRADVPVVQVITTHLDGEVIVPLALAIVGVLRAATASPVWASAMALATAVTVAAVR